MKRSRFTETQIISIPKEADAELAVKQVCRKRGISDATFYNWKSKYGGMSASELKRLREVEAENAKLKRMYAELTLENTMYAAAFAGSILPAIDDMLTIEPPRP